MQDVPGRASDLTFHFFIFSQEGEVDTIYPIMIRSVVTVFAFHALFKGQKWEEISMHEDLQDNEI
jgi:hypothetical protein